MDIKVKNLVMIHKIGDIIFVKKENNDWKIKQYPKVNGGIVVSDPFNGDVKALLEALTLNQVSLIE